MKTGVFDMPMDEYLSAHGVSQSSLKKLSRSPAHLKWSIEHPEPPTDAQVTGTIFDESIFSRGAKFKTCCYVQPSHYESKGEKKPWHNGATVCKEWNAARQDGKPIISQEDYSAVLQMREAVLSHPAAALALKTGAGKTLFCEDADTGLQLKARPDWLSGNVILDLKSCVDASQDGFSRAVAAFGYHIQAAFYLDVCATLGLGKEHFFFIACEKEPPYATAVWELEPEDIAIGRSTYRRLLNRYLECVVADQWPGYSRNVEKLSLPAWSKRQNDMAMLLEDQPIQPALTVE